MSLISQPTLDYSDKDFASLRLRLQGLARSVFPDWTDFNAANYGNLLLEMMAFVGDSITFYQDAQAREMFWPTLTRRISAIRQGRLINFTMPGASAASGITRISIPAVRTARVPIHPGTVIRSLDPITPLLFQTNNTSDVYIPIGQTFVDVTTEQTESITGEVYESNNAPNQEFSLSRIPFLDGSLNCVATDGTYTEIDSFLNVTSADPRKFVVVVDQNDRARPRFGNGTLGKIPQGTISFDYRVTSGARGNIESGKLGTVTDNLTDENATNVAGVVATNPAAFSGGADRMSVAQARVLAPASLRSLTRTVTKPDFENHALLVNGVARALMLTSNEDPSVQENNGVLLLIALGQKLASGHFAAATPTQTMINNVNDVFVRLPPTITFSLAVQSAVFKALNISCRVYLKHGAVRADVKTSITAALQDFFAVALADGTANTAVDFGANLKDVQGTAVSEIAWSDVFDVIHDATGVRKVDEGGSGLVINGLRQSIIIGLREFPQLGTLTIVDADTGLTL